MAETHLYRQPIATTKNGNANASVGTASQPFPDVHPMGTAYPPWPPSDQLRGPPQFVFPPPHAMPPSGSSPNTISMNPMLSHQPRHGLPNHQPTYNYPTPTSAHPHQMPLFMQQGLAPQGRYDAPVTAPPENFPWHEAHASDGKSAFLSLLEDQARQAYARAGGSSAPAQFGLLNPSSMAPPSFPRAHHVSQGTPFAPNGQPPLSFPIGAPQDSNHRPEGSFDQLTNAGQTFASHQGPPPQMQHFSMQSSLQQSHAPLSPQQQAPQPLVPQQQSQSSQSPQQHPFSPLLSLPQHLSPLQPLPQDVLSQPQIETNREAETGSAITTEEVSGQVPLLVDDAPPIRALYPPIDPTSVVSLARDKIVAATPSALHSTVAPRGRPYDHDAVAAGSSTSPEMLRKSSVAEVPHMTTEHHHMYNPTAPVANDLYAHPVFQWTPTLLESERMPATADTPASSKELIIREPALTSPLTGQTSRDLVYDIAGFIISDQADTAIDRFSKGIEHHLAYLEAVGINSNTVLEQVDDTTETDDVERATGRRDNIAGLTMAFDLDATQGSTSDNGVFVKIATRPHSLRDGGDQMKIQFVADRHTANGTSLYFMDVDQTASGPENEGKQAYHLSRYELEKTFVGDYLWIDPTNVVLGDSDGFLHLLQWEIPDIDRRAPSGTKRINVQPLAKLRAHQDGIREIAYQQEMRWTLSGADVGGLVISDVNIWDQKKGRVSTLPIPSNAGGVSTVRWHPSMKYALSCATDDGLFTLYDARTSRDVAGFESPVSIYSHTYTSDNMVYLGHSNGTICGYDLRSLRASRPVKDSMVTSIGYLDFNAEANMLVSMGFGGVTAWELSDRVTMENKSSVTPLRSMDLRDASRMRSISQTASFTVTGQFVDHTPHFAAITSDGIVALYDMLERNTSAK